MSRSLRIVLAIGCNTYEASELLPTLKGAEQDASKIFRRLTLPDGDYDVEASMLLHSPTNSEVRVALAALPFDIDSVESLTIFFAGHGSSKSGSYYLCLKDSDPSRLSTSALSLSELLSVVAELRPLQANIIIDACESGSSMIDSASILRADALGIQSTESLGVAFLAACGATEAAYEVGDSGALTKRVLSYLSGEKILQTTRRHLDLIDLGRRVSEEMAKSNDGQVPVTWGLNLIGEGRFAPNPAFQGDTDSAKSSDAPLLLPGGVALSNVLEALHPNALRLWNLHAQIEDAFDIDFVLRELRHVAHELRDNPASLKETVRGLATSLRASAAKSSDSFAEPIVLAACAIQLLGSADSAAVSNLAKQLIEEFLQALGIARRSTLERLKEDRYALLGDIDGIANLFYLPLRVSKLIGWLSVGIELSWLDQDSRAIILEESKELLELVLQEYTTALSTVSDEQAPYLLVYVVAAQRAGWNEQLQHVLSCYFAGFVQNCGAVARPGATGDQAFALVNGLGRDPKAVDHLLKASPSQLLAVLLISGSRVELDDVWDIDLHMLDHQGAYVFVPGEYRDFGKRIIEHGTNAGFVIGRDVFTLQDVRTFETQSLEPLVQDASKTIDGTVSVLALLASCLMPDRSGMHLLYSALSS